MITSISIRNFKSIHSEDINLSPFTVIVGANASGKSNLVKSIDFLSHIPRSGIGDAVNSFGGFTGIIPKVIPRSLIKSTHIDISYRIQLPIPDDFPSSALPLAVNHKIRLSHSPSETIWVTSEELSFDQPLSLAFVVPEDGIDPENPSFTEPNQFSIKRGPYGGVTFKLDPSFDIDPAGYLRWIGLYQLLEPADVSNAFFRKVLDRIESGGSTRVSKKERARRRFNSYIDPMMKTSLRFCSQFDVFKRVLGGIRRYDLLLGELRQAQRISDERRLTSTGDNMPSVLRHLRKEPTSKETWARILDTLVTISPHVRLIDSDTLRTGREFIQFIESNEGRAVESWESSDGTIRTLAILLALEASPSGTTILIEEPEQNLHPWAIRTLVDHFRNAISRRGIQIIVTTHSEHILHMTKPDELLVASRDKDTGTRFSRIEEILGHEKIQIGEIGELWVKGLLGGVPHYE